VSRETKFGYGFLFASIGLPYLIDKAFGTLPAIIISAACLVLGVFFLIAGHRHRDRRDARSRGTMATIGMFALIGAVLGAITGVISGGVWLAVNGKGKPSAVEDTAPSTVKPTEPFYVSIDTAKNTVHRSTISGFAGVFENEGKYTLIPINVSLYLSLTNRQPIQSKIDKYGVEAKTKSGKLVRLVRLETRNYEIYWLNSGITQSRLLNMVRFENLLFLRWLAPNENVRGWAFFEYPTGFEKEEFAQTYRITVIDAAGVTFTSPEIALDNGKSTESLQGALIEATPTVKDLSAATIKYAE
jgi:hypothetical protein